MEDGYLGYRAFEGREHYSIDVGGDEIWAWGTDHWLPLKVEYGRPLVGMIPRQKRKSQSLEGVRQLTERYVWLVVDGED